MLNLILGASGTGKSTLMRSHISAMAKNKQNCIVIVPDQFSFETERLLYRTAGKKAISQINVTTPSKLAKKILAENGIIKQYADNIVKQATMLGTISLLGGDLTFYGAMAKRASFPNRMLSVISNLKNADITVKKLRKMLSGDCSAFSENLYSKLSDILLLYESYNAALGEKFADKLDDLRLASELSAENNYFSGKNIYFDGFNGFSGNQLLLIREIIAQGAHVEFCLTTDQSDKIEFYAVNVLVNRLKEYARENSRETEITLLSENFREKSRACLRELPLIAEADCMTDECNYIAADIRDKIIAGKYRYNDILVMLADKDYASEMKSAFDRYGIPAFFDIPRSILTKPLVKFIILTIEATTLKTDALMRYIKSGFVAVKNDDGEVKPLARTDINKLEQLTAEWEITAREWRVPFPEDKEFARYEPLRKAITEPLIQLKKKISDTTGEKITEALADFLINDMRIESTVFALCKQGTGALGEDDTLVIEKTVNDEYRRLWELIMTVFESFYAALSGMAVTPAKYASMLCSVFSSTDISGAPQVLDAVTVGDISRTRKNAVKLLYIAGTANGNFPPPISRSEDFTSHELETMHETGMELKPNRKLNYSAEQFSVYEALNLAESEIVISYPLLTKAYKVSIRSAVVENLLKSGAELIYTKDRPAEFYASSKAAAKSLYAKYYHNVGSDERGLLADALKDDTSFTKKLDAYADMQRRDYSRFTLKPDTAEELFSHKPFSPTAVETLSQCRFNYFCKYGLHINEPKEGGFSASEIGVIMHYCLERSLKKYAEDYDAFINLTDSELMKLSEECLNEYRQNKAHGDFAKNARYDAILRYMRKSVHKLLRMISDELKVSEFRPKEFEKPIRASFGGIEVEGKLDRLDVFESDGNKYAKIVDYKGKSKEMKLSYVYYGLNLQMLLYLFAVCESAEYTPSGALYFPLTKESRTSENLATDEEKRLFYMKDHKLSGITINDNEAFGEYEKLVSEFSVGKGGKSFFDAESISTEQYNKLREYACGYLKSALSTILGGDISALPVSAVTPRSQKTYPLAHCEFCPFSKVCGNPKGEQSGTIIDENSINEILNNR